MKTGRAIRSWRAAALFAFVFMALATMMVVRNAAARAASDRAMLVECWDCGQASEVNCLSDEHKDFFFPGFNDWQSGTFHSQCVNGACGQWHQWYQQSAHPGGASYPVGKVEKLLEALRGSSTKEIAALLTADRRFKLNMRRRSIQVEIAPGVYGANFPIAAGQLASLLREHAELAEE